VIVVEGPVASGKAQFAKELAADLDMKYIEQPTLDEIFVTPYGLDLRTLDSQVPKNMRTYDIRNFCLDPTGRNAAQFQINMFMMRYEKYVDALAHLFSTGQGVVCNRSPFSDYVFVEAMHKAGYMSSGARSVYYDIRANTITEILKPHLVVYLDVPVSKVKENIKKRGAEHEVKSQVFSDNYLNSMETLYKQQHLKEISQHAELLVYDWSNGGETEVVVEDIERIDFDRFDHYDPKMKDWRLPAEWDWCEMRMRFTSEKSDLMNYFNVPRFDVPELLNDPDEYKAWHDVVYSAPGMGYAYGYNEDAGDTGILTKRKLERRTMLD
jgi:NADH dehydrogenase (ubiquinone) 1 alpha subcomplex subunit 10